MPFDYMGDLYTPFEQNLALSWAGSLFQVWLQSNPAASPEARKQMFFSCLEGGLSLALEFRHQNS